MHKHYKTMLNDYINEIKIVQAEGPYIIGGFCAGGPLCYEMAIMLEDMGEEVEKLIMLDEDPYLINQYPEMYINLISSPMMITMTHEERISFITNTLSQMIPSVDEQTKMMINHFINDIQNTSEAAEVYVPDGLSKDDKDSFIVK